MAAASLLHLSFCCLGVFCTSQWYVLVVGRVEVLQLLLLLLLLSPYLHAEPGKLVFCVDNARPAGSAKPHPPAQSHSSSCSALQQLASVDTLQLSPACNHPA
jgi:hypothetical protein